MNDPRSSNGRGGAAKQATATVSDLGIKRGAWKDLGEVSRGQQDISIQPACIHTAQSPAPHATSARVPPST